MYGTRFAVRQKVNRLPLKLTCDETIIFMFQRFAFIYFSAFISHFPSPRVARFMRVSNILTQFQWPLDVNRNVFPFLLFSPLAPRSTVRLIQRGDSLGRIVGACDFHTDRIVCLLYRPPRQRSPSCDGDFHWHFVRRKQSGAKK